jgi:putative transposase
VSPTNRPGSRKTFKYRLYPHRQQRERLQTTLDVCRELYNAALQERRDGYRVANAKLNYYTQANQLSEIKERRPDVASLHSQVLQDVLKRVDKAFKAFFRRVHRRQTPGFPRFRSRYRYDSFTYPQSGFQLGGKLQLSKVGNVKIKLHRELKGEIKTLSIKRENGNWYACFSCVVVPEPLPVLSNSTGIDVGLETFATLSNGDKIANPRWYRTAERRLRRAQRKVARRRKGKNRRRKAVALLAQVHKDIFNKRNDFQHKESRKLVQQYGTIFVEDLNLQGLSRGILAKSVHDASWASFLDKISYKAENAGRRFVQVNPRGTSQRCTCGADNPKKLSDREHVCVECGLLTTRDHASALEIQRLGLSLQALTILEVEFVA